MQGSIMAVRHAYNNAFSFDENLTFNNGKTNGVETHQDYYQ